MYCRSMYCIGFSIPFTVSCQQLYRCLPFILDANNVAILIRPGISITKAFFNCVKLFSKRLVSFNPSQLTSMPCRITIPIAPVPSACKGALTLITAAFNPHKLSKMAVLPLTSQTGLLHCSTSISVTSALYGITIRLISGLQRMGFVLSKTKFTACP